MAQSKVFPKGVIAFNKSEKAPEWVVGSLVINPNLFYDWLSGEGKQYLTDYKGAPQLKLSMTTSQDGRLSISVDTYKPASAQVTKEYDLPY